MPRRRRRRRRLRRPEYVEIKKTSRRFRAASSSCPPHASLFCSQVVALDITLCQSVVAEWKESTTNLRETPCTRPISARNGKMPAAANHERFFFFISPSSSTSSTSTPNNNDNNNRRLPRPCAQASDLHQPLHHRPAHPSDRRGQRQDLPRVHQARHEAPRDEDLGL